MELRNINTFLHVAELHSFFPGGPGAGLFPVGGVTARSPSWKRSWRFPCLTGWARRSG